MGHRLAAHLPGLALGHGPLRVAALDLQGFHFRFAHHQHRGVIGHQRVLLAQGNYLVTQVIGLTVLADILHDILDARLRPEPLDFRVVGILIRQGGGALPRPVLSGNPRFHFHQDIAGTVVPAEHHQLLALVEAADVRRSKIGDLLTVELQLHIMHGFVQDLGLRLQDYSHDVIAAGDIHGKPVGIAGEAVQKRLVGAVADHEGAQADIVCLEQGQEISVGSRPFVGLPVGDHDDASGAVIVEPGVRHFKPREQVGAAAGMDLLDLVQNALHI